MDGKAATSHASTATTYGAASASNYGHAMASSTTPKANGTAAVGSETAKFARGDHVHPLQTTVSGNAGTATKLATARTLSISATAGTTGTSFDGSANASLVIPSTLTGFTSITSTNFVGNASTATKATKDGSGNVIASTYMTKSNPTGTGSFSLNRKANSTIGDYSVAEGSDTAASGNYSHAEGRTTTASGNYSHAEGHTTTASGDYSHAEGWLTETSERFSHVQGKCNILGTNLAHIVGNGSSDTKRSNAHTLDWNGNAWFAGDVYVGSTSGTNKDAGSKKLATEDYINSKITYGTEDLEAGVSELATGALYFVYE